MERKRSSHSDSASIEHSPLLTGTPDRGSNQGISQHTQDAEVTIVPSVADPPADSAEADKEDTFSFRTLPAQRKWMLVSMACANLLAGMSFSLLAPFFPDEASRKGVSQTVIGFIFSVFELVIFTTSPIFGIYLTRIGSHFTFRTGLFVCGTSAILFGVLDRCPPGTIYIAMCFLVRSTEALGASAFITASFAIIANEFPKQVSSVYGALETFSGLGMMVGPPVGGLLYELGGFGVPFWVIGSILIVATVFITLFMPNRPDLPRPKRKSALVMLTSPLVLVTGLVIIAGAFSLGFLEPSLADHLNQFHLSTALVGLVFVVHPAMYAMTAPLWGYLSDNKGMSKPLILVGTAVSVVSFLLIGPAPFLPFPTTLWLVIVSLVLIGLAVGCALVSTLSVLVTGAKDLGFEDNLDTYGMVSGLLNSVFSFGLFIGPTAGGVLVEYYGYKWAATVTAAIFAFADGVSAHKRSIRATPGPPQEGDSKSMPQSPRMIPMRWRGPDEHANGPLHPTHCPTQDLWFFLPETAGCGEPWPIRESTEEQRSHLLQLHGHISHHHHHQ